MLTNHHTHTLYSDGSSHPEDYIRQAISEGFDLIGFSEHAPLPFSNPFSFRQEKREEYLSLMASLRQLYSGQISVFAAMEMDFIPGISEDFVKVRAAYNLDYLIGSVHLVKPDGHDALWFTDGPVSDTYDQGIRDFFGGDIRKAVTAYYRQVNGMITTQQFDILGHFDKIKMHNRNRFFREDEPWYKALVAETLELIAAKGLVVEVNTRGIYRKRSETTYPGPGVLEEMRKMNIPVMVNSDAHKPEELSGAYGEAFSILRLAGYTATVRFDGETKAFRATPIPG